MRMHPRARRGTGLKRQSSACGDYDFPLSDRGRRGCGLRCRFSALSPLRLYDDQGSKRETSADRGDRHLNRCADSRFANCFELLAANQLLSERLTRRLCSSRGRLHAAAQTPPICSGLVNHLPTSSGWTQKNS